MSRVGREPKDKLFELLLAGFVQLQSTEEQKKNDGAAATIIEFHGLVWLCLHSPKGPHTHIQLFTRDWLSPSNLIPQPQPRKIMRLVATAATPITAETDIKGERTDLQKLRNAPSYHRALSLLLGLRKPVSKGGQCHSNPGALGYEHPLDLLSYF